MFTPIFHHKAGKLDLNEEREVRRATKQERNKILAADVARLLEFSTAQTLNYIDLITALGLSEGDAGVRSRLKADFAAAGIDVSDAKLRLCMDALMVEAWQALRLCNAGSTEGSERLKPECLSPGAPGFILSLSIGQERPTAPPRGTFRLH